MIAPFVQADARGALDEPLLRRLLLGLALVGLAIGLAVWRLDYGDVEPRLIWAAATFPVVTVLIISIIRDLRIGRFGVDAIALISMSAALVLGEALAAIVVAIMYAGGTVLEDFARGRAERNLTALTDRSPRVAHRHGGDGLETVPVDQIAIDDALLVRAGELIPVDGSLTDSFATH